MSVSTFKKSLFLLDVAGHIGTRRGPDVARGPDVVHHCSTAMTSKNYLPKCVYIYCYSIKTNYAIKTECIYKLREAIKSITNLAPGGRIAGGCCGGYKGAIGYTRYKVRGVFD